MKVAHVSDCYLPRLGGIERQVHELATRQRDAGHDVVVVTSAPGDGCTEVDGIQISRPRSRGASPTRMHYEWTHAGSKAVLDGGFDMVHVHASSFSPLAFVTAARASAARIPTVVTVHSLWAGATPLFQGANLLARWGRWRVAWSAVSTPAAEPLRRILDHRTPVTILPNGVDPDEWKVTPLPRSPDRVVVATVGRLAVRKRPGPLLRMLREARSRLPENVHLEALLVGDGPLRRPLERYIATAGMGGWVSLRGRATHAELRDLYSGVDFYIAPATLESFGIAALEARCAGLPVVAHSRSGVSEFITDGQDGLLSGGDLDMVDSIVRLAGSPELREGMRAHACSTAAPVSWPGILDATGLLYERARAIAGAPEGRRRRLALIG